MNSFKYLISSILIILSTIFLVLFSCQSENEKDLYGKNGNDSIPGAGEIAYFTFDEKTTPQEGTISGSINVTPTYTNGITDAVNSALVLDGTGYFMITLGKTYDSLSLVYWFKNNNPVNSGYLPYLIDYGFGYSGARLDLDATSSATYIYLCADSTSLPSKNDLTSSDRVNSTEDWCLLYFECTGGHSRTMIKFTHGAFPIWSVDNTQDIPYGTSSATEIITIGKGTDFYGSYDLLNGAIDELHIYNTFLSDNEIQAFYDNRK